MLKVRRKVLILLSALLMTVLALLGLGIRADKASAEEPTFVKQQALTVIGAGNYDAPRYSPFDSINVYRTKNGSSVNWGSLDVRLPLSESDLSGYESIWVRMSSTRETAHIDAIVTAIDGSSVVSGWHATKGYASTPRYTASADGNPANAQAAEPIAQNYNYTKVEAPVEYWYEYTLSGSSLYTGATAYSTSTTATMDWSNTEYLLVRVAMNFTTCHMNIGEVYGKTADGEFTKLFDPATVETVGTNATDDVYVSAKDGALTGAGSFADAINDYRVEKFRAGEMKVGDNVTATWYGFSLLGLPTDMSAYNGISYYVDLTDCGKIFFNKFIHDTSNPTTDPATPVNEIWYSNAGFAAFYPDGGNGYYYFGTPNEIPTGFKGRIVVSFNCFNGGYGAGDGVLDLANTRGRLGFTLHTTTGRGNFVLKDVQLVSDAKAAYTAQTYFEDVNGEFIKSDYDNGKNLRVEVSAMGEAPTVPTLLDGYILDEERSNLTPFTGRPDEIWNYKPVAYYKLANDVTVEKVFGLSEAQTLPTTATAEEVLSKLPQGAVTLGLDNGELYQLKGKWEIVGTEGDVQLYAFKPDKMPARLVDPDGKLTVKIESYRAVKMFYATAPDKTNYRVGDELDLTGMQAGVIYMDGTIVELKATDYTLSGFDSTTAGEKTVTVSYTASGKTYEKTFTVTVQGATTVTAQEQGGCSGSLSYSVVGVLAVALVAFSARRRKHEEN